ncbi:Uncharacterised protein [Enterobacter hormaechei]|nr:Uncharacterised protein [Enterobacter hormaechei]CZV94195.1 Uncharacterised protein [Enterobacter hormaechei]SAA88221.1 Uncharacterised protein [Enterobacter hormaechei]SBM23757.1 Uncharacterised protein [Enterobacter hormaechei]SMF87954.1 hypothetical protein SAMN04487932_2466 [Enterobacter hormaechei]
MTQGHAKKQNAGTRPALRREQSKKLLSYYVNNQFSEHFAVNLEVNFVLTSGTQNAVRHTNFALSHFNACRSNCISDIASTDGTEQFTFVASFRRDSNGAQCVDCFSASVSSRQNVSQFGFQFSTTCFEKLYVFLSSWNSFTLWNQEVTSVTRFNVYLITQAAQVCYFIKQNNLHYLILLKSY